MKICAFLLFIAIGVGCSQPNSSSDTKTSPVEERDTPNVNPSKENEEVTTATQNTEAEVYVTNDGDKYHTADCRYSKMAHAVKLTQAKADGKTACTICKPNSKTGEKQQRCSGTTAEGKRCQRMTTDASGKCFQHRDS